MDTSLFWILKLAWVFASETWWQSFVRQVDLTALPDYNFDATLRSLQWNKWFQFVFFPGCSIANYFLRYLDAIVPSTTDAYALHALRTTLKIDTKVLKLANFFVVIFQVDLILTPLRLLDGLWVPILVVNDLVFSFEDNPYLFYRLRVLMLFVLVAVWCLYKLALQ